MSIDEKSQWLVDLLQGSSLFMQLFREKSCQKSGKTLKCNFSDNIFAKNVVKKVEWQFARVMRNEIICLRLYQKIS